MRNMSLVLLVLVALSLAGVGSAAANDFCVEDSSGTLIVGKGFSLPAAGACKDFRGYAGGAPVNGTACGTSDDAGVVFTLQWGAFTFMQMDLTRSTPTGTILYCEILGSSCFGKTVSKIDCPTPHPF